MQAALPFFIADGAQSQGQQFLRLQYGINIAGITLRITKGSIQQRFGNAGRLYAQPACAGQADRPGCRSPRCLWQPRQFQTARKARPFPLSPSSQIPPWGCGRYCRGTKKLSLSFLTHPSASLYNAIHRTIFRHQLCVFFTHLYAVLHNFSAKWCSNGVPNRAIST